MLDKLLLQTGGKQDQRGLLLMEGWRIHLNLKWNI